MVGNESTTKNVRSHPEPINWSLRELEGVLGNFVKGLDATARAQAMAQKMIKDKEENRYKTVQGTFEGTVNDDQQTNQSKEKAWVEVTKGG